MTGFAPARAGHGFTVAEWGFAPTASSLRLNGAVPPGRTSRGRITQGFRFRFGTSSTISADTLSTPTADRFLMDLGSLATRCVIRFTVSVPNASTGSGFVLGAHHLTGATSQNAAYHYHGGDGAANQGIRVDDAGSDSLAIAQSTGGSGTFSYEIRWQWPEVEVLRGGTLVLSRAPLTGAAARLSRGPLFGPRGSGGSPAYTDVEVWAAPRLWRFARFPR